MKITSFAKCISLLMLGMYSSASAQEEIIYSERFVNDRSEDMRFNDSTVPYQWSILYDVQPGNWFGVSAGVGTEINFDDSDKGYIFLFSTPSTDILAISNETVDRSQYEISKITLYVRDSAKSWPQESRFAVKIDGSWYVMNSGVVTPVEAAFANFTFYELAFSSDASAWSQLIVNESATDNYDPNLEIGSALTADLPGGNIENWGFFSINQGEMSMILDEITIFATPVSAGDPDGNDWYDVLDESAFGTIWDVSGNYVWYSNLGWAYMLFSGGPTASEGGIFAWKFDSSSWVWLAEDFGGWYYDYGIADWAFSG